MGITCGCLMLWFFFFFGLRKMQENLGYTAKQNKMLVVQNPDKNIFTTKVQITGLVDNLRLSNIILNLLLIVAE